MKLPVGIDPETKVESGLLLSMANRHGLIAGATGTGKTVTLQGLAENFSKAGVSVFTADVKGDLSGISKSGTPSSKLLERCAALGIGQPTFEASPVVFWDLYQELGIPIRTTVSEVGPLLFARLLDLNNTQEQVLQILFKAADDQGLLLLDLKDSQSLVRWATDNIAELKKTYGSIAPVTLQSISRALLTLDTAGGAKFFGEPALNIKSLIQTDFSGRGVINVLDATKLLNEPKLYATFLLCLLSELFEHLEEVGDREKPKLVFFFDEAHLLFNEASKELTARIEQVVRLIRSKGVGIYFVTQNPLDIPETVLGQLGNRVQHALRAFTPADQKAVKTAAKTFRSNAKIDTEKVITELKVGEALVSFLDENGSPTPVERVMIVPPRGQIGPITSEERKDSVERSPMYATYFESIDRESAFEQLKKRAEEKSTAEIEKTKAEEAENNPGFFGRIFGSDTRKKSTRQGFGEAMAKSVIRSASSTIGREIIRGILGSMRR